MARRPDPNAKAALIAAARAEFRQHGIQRARIEDITAACGLSKGAFYLHYESKEALFGELVATFEGKMGELFERRTTAEEAFFVKSGPFRGADFSARTSRVLALNELQMRYDTETLELMWAMRDVIYVLISGCQGTAFDGVFWQALDRESSRVLQAADRLKKFGVVRSDVSSEIVSTVLMGAWVLIVRKMVAQPQKPDFATLLSELNMLVGEGLAPRTAPASARRPRRRRVNVSPAVNR